MLKRKIEEKLQFWFEHRNQAMLISGARQIGKTFAIKHFIESHFESAVEIDFANGLILLILLLCWRIPRHCHYDYLLLPVRR